MQIEELPFGGFARATGDAGLGRRHEGLAALPPNQLWVPSVKQRTNFSCGNAATLALLRYWQWSAYAHVEESALYLPLETTHARGTEPQPIVAYLTASAGLTAEYRHSDVSVSDLERAVDRGEPPIVDLQAWRDYESPWREVWDAGHYVVMVGYDAERLFFMDPSTMTPGPYAYLGRDELGERWHDLAGERDEMVEKMVIFIRGGVPSGDPQWQRPDVATRLG